MKERCSSERWMSVVKLFKRRLTIRYSIIHACPVFQAIWQALPSCIEQAVVSLAGCSSDILLPAVPARHLDGCCVSDVIHRLTFALCQAIG
jgi:hypothetical protein